MALEVPRAFATRKAAQESTPATAACGSAIDARRRTPSVSLARRGTRSRTRSRTRHRQSQRSGAFESRLSTLQTSKNTAPNLVGRRCGAPRCCARGGGVLGLRMTHAVIEVLLGVVTGVGDGAHHPTPSSEDLHAHGETLERDAQAKRNSASNGETCATRSLRRAR
jgi:hypothetical protein